MRFALRTLTIAAALAFGASQFASASLPPNNVQAKPVLTLEGLTKMGNGAPAPYAVLSPQHQLFFVRKAGAPVEHGDF